jgi:plasmid replication initiation protein
VCLRPAAEREKPNDLPSVRVLGQGDQLRLEGLVDATLRQPTALAIYRRQLDPRAQKIAALVEFHVQNSTPDTKGLYLLPKAVMREFIGWDDSHNYATIYESFKELHTKVIEWNCFRADSEYDMLTMSLIISSARPSSTGHYLAFRINPDIEPLIKQPSSYSELRLMVAPLLRQRYAWAMFELFCSSIVGENGLEIRFADLKDMLSVNSNTKFKYFRRDVLDPAIEEINTNTELFITYDTKRMNRQIEWLQFTVTKQPWQVPDSLKSKTNLLGYLEKVAGIDPVRLARRKNKEFLSDLGLTDKEVEKYLASPLDGLRKHIDAANHYITKLGSNLNTSRTAIYRKALEQQWEPALGVGCDTSGSRNHKKRGAVTPGGRKGYDDFLRLSSQQQASVLAQFREYLDRSWIVGRQILDNSGMQNAGLIERFEAWYPDQFESTQCAKKPTGKDVKGSRFKATGPRALGSLLAAVDGEKP